MRHAEAYTVLFDGFVRRLCATASRDDSLPLLALHRRRWRSGASDLLVHAARDGAARGRLRAFAGGLLGRAEGAGAVGPPAELDADAALNLGPRRGHEEEERGDGEDGCDAVQGGSSHSAIAAAGGAKVGSGAGLSTMSQSCRCALTPLWRPRDARCARSAHLRSLFHLARCLRALRHLAARSTPCCGGRWNDTVGQVRGSFNEGRHCALLDSRWRGRGAGRLS